MAHRIAVIPGDKCGPEIVREGMKVLRQAQALGCGAYDCTEFPWGADYHLQHGAPMPEDGVETLKGFDAVYFGAHGDPRLPERITSQGLMHRMRRGLRLTVNTRPITLWPGVTSPIRDKTEMDFVVVRENSEGEYSNIGGRLHAGTPEELTIQVSFITRRGAERVMRFAFDLARKRNGKKRVTAATKSNALNHSMPLWDEVFEEVAKAYPDVENEKLHIDNFSMQLIKRPESFDVIVATNQMGDILSDEAAYIAGGVGLAPGANLDPGRKSPSLFEPIHGSAPRHAGKNTINPVATILAGALMLEWLGEAKGAELIRSAVGRVLAEGTVRTRDLGGNAGTSDMGDAVCAAMAFVAGK
jgi:tartrate dehydrogenase/decarboxylase / D-malate dehydrogenase